MNAQLRSNIAARNFLPFKMDGTIAAKFKH